MRGTGGLQVAERALACVEVEQRRGRRAIAKVDDAAENCGVINSVGHPLDPAVNGRQHRDVGRPVVGAGNEAQTRGGLGLGRQSGVTAP